MPIYKYLDLSTGHMTPKDADELDNMCGVPGASLVAVNHGHGFWVHVPEDNDSAVVSGLLSDEFIAVLDYARANDCTWVNFDNVADVIDGLPTFDW